jgi:hypothetical protein
VRLRQYCYFSIASDHLTAESITTYLGLDPDEATVRGSKSTSPMRPAAHRWVVACRDSGLAVDEQITRIVDRLRPYANRIGELSAGSMAGADNGCAMTLQIVREFGRGTSDGQVGWHLDTNVLEFLRLAHAELDVDEYDFHD